VGLRIDGIDGIDVIDEIDEIDEIDGIDVDKGTRRHGDGKD